MKSMKHIKMTGLCLAAVLALGALIASEAQASGPEWGHCVAMKDGNYTEGNCQTVAEKKGKPDHKGADEWIPGSQACYKIGKGGNYTETECKTVAEKNGKPDHKGAYEKTGGGKFTAKGGEGVLKAVVYTCFNSEEERLYFPVPRSSPECAKYVQEYSKLTVVCTSEQAAGEATGSDGVAKVSAIFKGCKDQKLWASTKGRALGEITVNELKGRLGYINKAATPEPEVGVLLEPETPGGDFAQFEVENIGYVITVGAGNAKEGSFWESSGPGVPNGNDGIISRITPVDKMTTEFTQKYKFLFTEDVVTTYLGPDTGNEIENVPSHFENESTQYRLETFFYVPSAEIAEEWSPAGQELTNVSTTEEGAAEIKA